MTYKQAKSRLIDILDHVSGNEDENEWMKVYNDICNKSRYSYVEEVDSVQPNLEKRVKDILNKYQR